MASAEGWRGLTAVEAPAAMDPILACADPPRLGSCSGSRRCQNRPSPSQRASSRDSRGGQTAPPPPHPTLRRLLPHQTLAAELRCTSGEVQNRKAKNQRVQARAFSPALAAAAEYPICIAARRASEVRLVPGDRGLLCPSAGPLDPATAAAISRLLARIGAGDEGDGGCRGSAGSSLASSAPSRGRGGHQEDAVELGKFACCFPTTKLRRGCAAATYRSCCQRPPFHAPVANDDLPYKLLLVQIILEEEMWGVKVLYREVVSVANTIGNILKCNVQALRWLRID
ncbi:uncharacterized protein [Lolium perenne]|uniref:uncharacterized protein n=1 Tax=Lolium perenne TaxID=4522 RepID=UPI003A9A5325